MNIETEKIIHNHLSTTEQDASQWPNLKEKLLIHLQDQTQRKKARDSEKLQEIKKEIANIDRNYRKGTWTAEDPDKRNELCEQLTNMKPNDRLVGQTIEDFIYEQDQRHDTGRSEMYQRVTRTTTDSWIHMIENLHDTSGNKPYLHHSKDIVESFKQFYQTLFEPKHTKNMHLCLEVLKDPCSQQILQNTASLCSSNITTTEIIHTASNLPTGKAPGPDRIPNKFYKTFIHKIAKCMSIFINDSKHSKRLSHNIGDGIISVLYKKMRELNTKTTDRSPY